MPTNRVQALIGPSGCGKSTFLRALDRMHDLTPGARIEGVVELDGKNIYDDDVDPVSWFAIASAWYFSGRTLSRSRFGKTSLTALRSTA